MKYIILLSFMISNLFALSLEEAQTLSTITAGITNGKVYQVADTGSMLPTLNARCLAVTSTVPFKDLNKDDIVVYRSQDGQPIVHRLKKKKKDELWCAKGDNNASFDQELVSASNYLGKVCTVFEYGNN